MCYKRKKITCAEHLEQLGVYFVNEYNRILEEEINLGFDVFKEWFSSELDKLFELVGYVDSMDNDLLAILDGYSVRKQLNFRVENPYDVETTEKLDNKIKDLINGPNYLNEIVEVFNMGEIINKEQSKHLAEIISSRYKSVKDVFITDFEVAWKNVADNFFESMSEVTKILQEYTLPEKRGTPEEIVRRAAEYDEALKIIGKIGQKCRDKIEDMK